MAGTQEDLVPIPMCWNVQASIVFNRDIPGLEVVSRMDALGCSGWASPRKPPTPESRAP